MEISKSAVLLANEHQRTGVPLCIRSSKNNSVNGMPENVAARRSVTNLAASVFHRK